MPFATADSRVAYGPAAEQFGELWVPGGFGPHPVVALIHGGCWQAEYDLTHIRPLATALRDAGYAVWSIEYRRVGSAGGGWPGTFLDIGAAVDHLRTLAPLHALDLNHLVVTGHSAGGHLALWTGARGALPRESAIASPHPLLPCGVVSLAGITDLAAYASVEGCGSAVVPLMGGTEQVPDRYAHGSPVLCPPKVPVQLIVASDDAIVPRAQAGALLAVMGERATLRVVHDAGHFDVIAPDGDAWLAVKDALRALLQGGVRLE